MQPAHSASHWDPAERRRDSAGIVWCVSSLHWCTPANTQDHQRSFEHIQSQGKNETEWSNYGESESQGTYEEIHVYFSEFNAFLRHNIQIISQRHLIRRHRNLPKVDLKIWGQENGSILLIMLSEGKKDNVIWVNVTLRMCGLSLCASM